jgi:glycosyltransferase involved in cell wall biosynthesis
VDDVLFAGSVDAAVEEDGELHGQECIFLRAMPPVVSIILPTYDRIAFLREAVESVLAQTVAEWELIIADDGSTDDTVSWLASLGDRRIVVLQHEHTAHKSALRNSALARATADWIAFLDSDDRWHPAKLDRQLAFHAAHPGVRWSYTGRRLIDADGRELSATLFGPWRAHSGWILDHVIALEANIALPSVMVERALLQQVGGFNEAFHSAEDFELWVRLAECCECGLVDEPLLDVRKHKATSYQRADVSLGFVQIYRDFAARTTDHHRRTVARQHEAVHAVAAAERLGLQRRWREARHALALAVRARASAPFVYRAIARHAQHRLRAMMVRSTAPVA